MAEYLLWTNIDHMYLVKLFRWFDCSPQCTPAFGMVKQTLKKSELVLKDGVEFIPDELQRKRKRLKKQPAPPPPPVDPNTGEQPVIPITESDQYVEYADLLYEKKDYTHAIYNMENLQAFVGDALRYRLLAGFCCYIITVKEGQWTAEMEIFQPFYSMDYGDSGVFKIVPADTSVGVMQPDIVVSLVSTSKKPVYSHSNHSTERWKRTRSNYLGEGRYLYVHIWDKQVPMIRGTGAYSTVKPVTPMVPLYEQIDQLNTLESEQYATLHDLRKGDIILTSRPRLPMTTNEIGTRVLGSLGATTATVVQSDRDDYNQYGQRWQQQNRQRQILQQQQFSFVNPTDPSEEKVITRDGELERHHMIPDGYDVGGLRFASETTKSLEISIKQKEQLFSQVAELIQGYDENRRTSASGGDSTRSGASKIAGELNFMKYSSVLNGHHEGSLDLLNAAHQNVVDLFRQKGIEGESQVNWEVSEDQSKPLIQIRKRLLRSGFGPVFSARFTFETTSHTKKILSVEEMKQLAEIGVMDKEELRARVV